MNNAVSFHVFSKAGIDFGLKLNTYLKYDVDVWLSILQAGIDRRVLINAVHINGKFEINATSTDIFKIQGWFNILRCFVIIIQYG